MDAAALDDRTLRRIATKLVALAGLADRAAGRSWPIRWLVLLVLYRAEAGVLAFLARETQTDWSCFIEDPAFPACRMDAALVAWRLRALAALLGSLLEPECPYAGRMARPDATQHDPAPSVRQRPTAPRGALRWQHDTS